MGFLSGLWGVVLAVLLFFWVMFKIWAWVLIVPFTSANLVWIIIPIWLVWFFAEFFVLAVVMFYTAQWGGGDAKLFMGLGAMLGLQFTIHSFIVSFLINTMLIGAAYGFVWMIASAVRNRKKFMKQLRTNLNKYIPHRKLILILVMVLLIAAFVAQDVVLKILLLGLMIATALTFYLWLCAKTVEKCCMEKIINVEKLTEGDWIVKDVKIDGKRICGPKDLGIEKKQIKQLIAYKRKGKISKILIKEGIPFVPSFLTSFLITMWLGNLALLLF